MNRIINFFDFGFLQRWDRYLLLKHTFLWNMKLPYVLFYGLFINIALFSFLYFYDLKLYQVKSVYYILITIFSIISLSTFIYWIYKQTKYAPTAEYARKRIGGLKEYVLNLISIVLILLPLITINIIVQLKYQYTNESSLIFYTVKESKLQENILQITNIDNYSKITEKIIDKAKSNFRAINDWNYANFITFWILFFIVFIPFLLIIYRSINLKIFLGSLGFILIAIASSKLYNLDSILYNLFLITISLFYFK